jgi:acetyl esterase/lipase
MKNYGEEKGMNMELWPEGAPYALGNEDEDRPDLTPYILRGEAEPKACIIVCPGGGYAKRAPHEGGPVAEWLNSIGISAFVLKYRVAPNRHPAPLTDAQRAIRYVRSHAGEFGVDPDRIGILGFSAGGHLAASAGTHYDAGNPDAADPIDRSSCRPDLMILCYPVVSFCEFRHQGSLNNLLGKDAPEELIRLMSNELQVTEDTPPAFLWHTTDDPGVPVENSLLFAAALRKHRIPCELHCFETGRHGLGLAAEHKQAFAWTGLCERWLRLRGF